MKIVLVVSSYAPNVGGLQTVTGQLARELHERGDDVTVVTNRYPRTLAHYETLNDVPVIRWLFIAPRLKQLSNLRPDLFVAGLICLPLTLIRLVGLLRRRRPDVVNLHFVGGPALFVLIASWFLSFRLIVSLHGDDVEGLGERPGFDRWVFRSILRRADVVTACSRYLLDQAILIVPGARQKGRVIHNGIDTVCKSSAQGNTGNIVAAGRMVPTKGFDVLLQARARSGGKLTLTLIGDGPEREKLEQLARELGLNGEIRFEGALARNGVLRAIAAADLVVIPSRQETFGLVALEAMVLGKPVVATNVGGLPELLEGADAVLVEPDNVAALARGIDSALERITRHPEFGLRNRELAGRFSIDRVVGQYLALYKH